MNKAQKGRFKKLRHKADSNNSQTCTGRTSGIQSFSDADELLELMKLQASTDSNNNLLSVNSATFAPSLHLVKSCPKEEWVNPEKWKVVDACNHRDLILSALLHSGADGPSTCAAGQKRSRHTSIIPTVSIPSWVRIHNPALLRNLVIIEFNIGPLTQELDNQLLDSHRRNDESFDIMPSTRLRKEMSRQSSSYSTLTKLITEGGYLGRTAIPFKTQVFQERPKYMTDVLMYCPLSSESEVDQDKPINPSNASITERLSSLLLTQQELEQEGFPRTKDPTFDINGDILRRIIEVSLSWNQSSIDLYEPLPFHGEEALQVVKALVVEVEGIEIVHTDEYREPKRYVSSCISRKEETPVVFAIDCEMVQTVYGLELARVTVLQYNPSDEYPDSFNKVFDSYVKPSNKIVDYKTEFSGITAKKLESVTTKIEDIQATLVSLIFKEDLIIGHSLENDLNVLRFIHENVIDTSVLFRGDGRKYSLRHLAHVLLQRKIQEGASGHDSSEDAAAALHLVLKRARVGPSFRLKRKDQDKINIFDLAHTIAKSHQNRVCCRMHPQGVFACLGPKDWIQAHVGPQSSVHALSCETINSSTVQALNSWMKSGQRKAHVIWARFDVDETNAPSSNQKIDVFLDKLLSDSPICTVFHVTFQRGCRYAKALSRRKAACKSPKSTLGWTSAQENYYNQKIKDSEWADAFWIFKADSL